MLLILYITSLLGSFSIGYSLLRIGFPEYQEKTSLEKIGYGYLVGIIVFIPSIISVFLTNEKFFFLFATGSFAVIFIAMLIIRTYYQKKDKAELIKKEFSRYVPKKAMTKQERERIGKENEEKEEENTEKYDIEKFKKEKAEEFGVSEKFEKSNISTLGNKESGLFIKTSENRKASEKKKKEDEKENNQIFKEKEPNVIAELRRKTIGNSEEKKSISEKEEELKKLRELLKKKKSGDNELDELSELEKELSGFDD